MKVIIGLLGDIYVEPKSGEKLPDLSMYRQDSNDICHYLPLIRDKPCQYRHYLAWNRCRTLPMFSWWCELFQRATCIKDCENCNERCHQSQWGTAETTIQLSTQRISEFYELRESTPTNILGTGPGHN